MPKNCLTDDQVEQEIERLQNSDFVKLAQREERFRYRRRQYLYSLLTYEKKGEALAAAGVTMEMFGGFCDEDFGA